MKLDLLRALNVQLVMDTVRVLSPLFSHSVDPHTFLVLAGCWPPASATAEARGGAVCPAEGNAREGSPALDQLPPRYRWPHVSPSCLLLVID